MAVLAKHDLYELLVFRTLPTSRPLLSETFLQKVLRISSRCLKRDFMTREH